MLFFVRYGEGSRSLRYSVNVTGTTNWAFTLLILIYLFDVSILRFPILSSARIYHSIWWYKMLEVAMFLRKPKNALHMATK